MRPENPWELSEGQCKALDAIIEHKTMGGAAMALRISPKTVSVQTIRARQKMGASNLLDVLLTWDRFRRTV